MLVDLLIYIVYDLIELGGILFYFVDFLLLFLDDQLVQLDLVEGHEGFHLGLLGYAVFLVGFAVRFG